MTRRSSVVITLTLLIAMSGCGEGIGAGVLWLPANAKIEVNAISMKAARGEYRDGSADVVFTVAAQDSEDGEKLTAQLKQHFEQAGWQHSTQWRNLGLASSFMAGWTHGCGCVIPTDAEGRVLPVHRTYQWHGEWENQEGDTIAYHLSRSNGYVRGYAQYSPARAIRARLNRLGKRQVRID